MDYSVCLQTPRLSFWKQILLKLQREQNSAVIWLWVNMIIFYNNNDAKGYRKEETVLFVPRLVYLIEINIS